MEAKMTIEEIESKIENLKIRFSKMKMQDKNKGLDADNVFVKFKEHGAFNNTEEKMSQYYGLLRQEARAKASQRDEDKKEILTLLKNFKRLRESDIIIDSDALIKCVDLESEIDILNNETHAISEVARFLGYIFVNNRLKNSKAVSRDINETYEILGTLEATSQDKPLSSRHYEILGGIFNKKCEEITSIWQKYSETSESE